MRNWLGQIIVGAALAFAGCQTSSFAPPTLDTAIIRMGAARHADERTLNAGRDIFVSRCIECHTLPVISRYPASAWPGLVDQMAKRADLKSAERDAIVAYLVAVRETQPPSRVSQAPRG
jgi:mono/diheme cytochrome c family protein